MQPADKQISQAAGFGNPRPAVARRELVALMMLMAAGLAVRVYGFGRLGLVHYDEGVYCTDALAWARDDGAGAYFANYQRFAPPAYHVLVGAVSRIFSQPADVCAIGISVVAGVLTIPVLWWWGRSVAGPASGLVAAGLAAVCEFPAAISRMALTDGLFAFVFLVATQLVWTALRRASVVRSVAAGLAVGLAWNTKYHGWLALVIPAVAYVLFRISRSNHDASLRRVFACWLTAAIVAGGLYGPWAWRVHADLGGYSALAAYQRTFLSKTWLTNLMAQALQQRYFDGRLTHAAPAVALIVATCAVAGLRGSNVAQLAMFSIVAAAGFALGGTVVIAAAAVAGILLMGLRWRGSAWLAPTFVLVMLMLTPMYRPYARLALPLVLGSYVAAGAALSALLRTTDIDRARRPVGGFVWSVAALIVVGAAAAAGWSRNVGLWAATDAYRHAAARFASRIPAHAHAVVMGDAPLVYYLRAAGVQAFPDNEDPHVIERSADKGGPVFVIEGLYTKRAPWCRAAMEGVRARLQRIAEYHVMPGGVRLLDDFSPADARKIIQDDRADYDLTLYEVRGS